MQTTGDEDGEAVMMVEEAVYNNTVSKHPATFPLLRPRPYRHTGRVYVSFLSWRCLMTLLILSSSFFLGMCVSLTQDNVARHLLPSDGAPGGAAAVADVFLSTPPPPTSACS